MKKYLVGEAFAVMNTKATMEKMNYSPNEAVSPPFRVPIAL
jgi:hypothetical protein